MLCAAFVHLGGPPPKHLLLNLNKTNRLFPNISLYLITDHPEYFTRLHSDIVVFKYTRSENHKITFDKLDDKFRSGFWTLTIERLYALEQFHNSNHN